MFSKDVLYSILGLNGRTVRVLRCTQARFVLILEKIDWTQICCNISISISKVYWICGPTDLISLHCFVRPSWCLMPKINIDIANTSYEVIVIHFLIYCYKRDLSRPKGNRKLILNIELYLSKTYVGLRYKQLLEMSLVTTFVIENAAIDRVIVDRHI